MAADYEKIISQLKENLEKSKSMKFRAEAKLEQLNKQKEEIISEIRSMGLEPDKIDQEISKLQEQIDVLIEESKEASRRYHEMQYLQIISMKKGMIENQDI